MRLNEQRAYNSGSKLAWLIHAELILCGLIIWCTFAGMEGMVSKLFAASFIVLLVLVIMNIHQINL